MTYRQLVQPDLEVTGRSGYCLEMQENVWHSNHMYLFAEQAWNENGPNHPGELPPEACVPVYWTYFDVADNTEYGHVATWVPGRGVYSSTFNIALGAEWYPTIQDMTNRINKIPGANGKYLGWSEVIANVKVVEGESMTDPNQIKTFCWAFFGRDARPTEVETYSALPLQETINRILTSQEYLDFYDYRNKALAPVEPTTPLPNHNPLPEPTPLPPTDQAKVNIFVALWKAIFG